MFIKEIKYLAARAARWNSLNYLYMVETQFENFLFPLSAWLCCKVKVETTCQEVGMKIHCYCWRLGWFLTQVSKQSCDKTTLYLLLTFPLFWFGQVWLQFVYRFWSVFMNVRKIAPPVTNYLLSKNKKKCHRFPLFSLGFSGVWCQTLPLT